jgi:hypothetical protein
VNTAGNDHARLHKWATRHTDLYTTATPCTYRLQLSFVNYKNKHKYLHSFLQIVYWYWNKMFLSRERKINQLQSQTYICVSFFYTFARYRKWYVKIPRILVLFKQRKFKDHHAYMPYIMHTCHTCIHAIHAYMPMLLKHLYICKYI